MGERSLVLKVLPVLPIFVLHQMVALFAALAIHIVLELLLWATGYEPSSPPARIYWEYVSPPLISFLIPFFTWRRRNTQLAPGRWVWVIPVVLLTCEIVREARQHSLAEALRTYAGLHSSYLIAWNFYTQPTFAAISYSLGALVALRVRREQMPILEER